LVKGDFAHGWQNYEARFQTKSYTPRPGFFENRWTGQPVSRKRVLLYSEQGHGDTIQFIRYTPIVQALGATVIVVCQRALFPLFSSCWGIDRLLSEEQDVPPYDFHCPLASLPLALRTTLTTIPTNIPYLFVPSTTANRWRQRLAGDQGLKVGIAWQGNPAYPGDEQRSIRLRQFAPLASLPGVRLYSLQKGAGSEQLNDVDFPVVDFGDELDGKTPWLDTAALCKSLDLVISSDTAVPHLAGALGVPVWTLLPLAADWRWLLDRSDSPWYPTMRLFRQKTPGDWAEVFSEVRTALQQLTE
jgi:hypothetical protein